jgi:hypothetical protein
MTITELLVSVILIGMTSAVIGELVVVNTYASTKLTNTIDGEVGCSRAVRRISEDVRSARIIGNIYAVYRNQNQFPDNSAASVDPYNVVPPIGGWPASWTQTPPAIPYKLGPQTLILQLPVYYQDPTNQTNPLNGIPLILPASSLVAGTPPTGVPTSGLEYVDTVVYQIVPDTVNIGTYQLQVARFAANIPNPPGVPNISGVPNSLLRPPLNPPQTVLIGIVGPMNPADGTNQPSIFQYLTSPVGNAPPLGNAPPQITVPFPVEPPQIVGVSINVEVQVPANNTGANVHIAPAHVESYMRASQYLKQTNF